MSRFDNFRIFSLIAAILLGFVAEAHAQQGGRPPMREHTATSAKALSLVKASKSVTGAEVSA